MAIAIVTAVRTHDTDHYDDVVDGDGDDDADDDNDNTFFIPKSDFSFRYYNYVKW